MKYGAVLITVIASFTIVSCKRTPPTPPQTITVNFILDLKIKTGVTLPKACKLVTRDNDSRLDSEIWLFEIHGADRAQYPGKLNLLPEVYSRGTPEEMESMSGMSIGVPTAVYFGVWQISNSQCHATLVVTTNNSSYLMLEKLH
jgi:hypothetical protein